MPVPKDDHVSVEFVPFGNIVRVYPSCCGELSADKNVVAGYRYRPDIVFVPAGPNLLSQLPAPVAGDTGEPEDTGLK